MPCKRPMPCTGELPWAALDVFPDSKSKGFGPIIFAASLMQTWTRSNDGARRTQCIGQKQPPRRSRTLERRAWIRSGSGGSAASWIRRQPDRFPIEYSYAPGAEPDGGYVVAWELAAVNSDSVGQREPLVFKVENGRTLPHANGQNTSCRLPVFDRITDIRDVGPMRIVESVTG